MEFLHLRSERRKKSTASPVLLSLALILRRLLKKRLLMRPLRGPANRIGSTVYSTAQLKTLQEVITLIVFAGFSIFWLGEDLTWNHAIGFALIAVGASFIFRG